MKVNLLRALFLGFIGSFVLGLLVVLSVPDAHAAGGTQTRTVVCKDSQGNTVADSYCAGPKPAMSQDSNVCQATGCTVGARVVVNDMDWEPRPNQGLPSACVGRNYLSPAAGGTGQYAKFMGACSDNVDSSGHSVVGDCLDGVNTFNSPARRCEVYARLCEATQCSNGDRALLQKIESGTSRSWTTEGVNQPSPRSGIGNPIAAAGCSARGFTEFRDESSDAAPNATVASMLALAGPGGCIEWTKRTGGHVVATGEDTNDSYKRFRRPGCSNSLTCGSANGTIVASQPTANLCSDASAPTVTAKSDGTGWTWTCGTNSCAAVKASTCPNSFIAETEQACIDAGYANPYNVNEDSGSDRTCGGEVTGHGKCCARLSQSGSMTRWKVFSKPCAGATCGSANGTIVTTQPTANLCSSGSATGMTPKSDGTGWTWSCGSNSCAAVKAGCRIGQTEVPGTCTVRRVSWKPTANDDLIRISNVVLETMNTGESRLVNNVSSNGAPSYADIGCGEQHSNGETFTHASDCTILSAPNNKLNITCNAPVTCR